MHNTGLMFVLTYAVDAKSHYRFYMYKYWGNAAGKCRLCLKSLAKAEQPRYISRI